MFELPFLVHLEATVALAEGAAEFETLLALPVQLSVELQVLLTQSAFFCTHCAGLRLWVFNWIKWTD